MRPSAPGFKADAAVVRMASGAASGAGGAMAGADAEVTRLRFGLEGTRPFRLGNRSVLTPGMEIALRRDGGDAETGFGAKVGAGFAWSDPTRGLGAELRAYGLLTHEAAGFRRRGLAGSVSWDPVAGDRGPRLGQTRTPGLSARRGADIPAGLVMPTAPAANEPGAGVGDLRAGRAGGGASFRPFPDWQEGGRHGLPRH